MASRVSLNSEASSVSTTIAASDPITVSLSGPASVEEGSETADYTVSLSGGTPTADLTVDYATADGTAEAGSDYTAKSGTLTFTAADHADKTSRCRPPRIRKVRKRDLHRYAVERGGRR